jgi:hypothetical protein
MAKNALKIVEVPTRSQVGYCKSMPERVEATAYPFNLQPLAEDREVPLEVPH